MRLVIATPLYPPDIGGPATYVRLLEKGLPGKGIEVDVVKFGDVRRLPKLIRHYAYYRRVLTAARSADVVLALDPVSVGLPAMKAAKRAGKPFVVKIVGDYAWEQGQQRFGVTQSLDEFVKHEQKSFFVRRLQKIQTHVAKNAARVIVPSFYLKSIVSHGWGIPEEKIEVIYNSMLLGELGVVPKPVASLPRPFVVSVGRLVPWKRFDGVIDAVARVPQFSLVIVGDGPEREALHKRAEEKLGSRCLFSGKLSHADTLAVMRESSALILNSTYEGLSHVLIEAQSLGVPAIVSSYGGNPEVITNGANGLVVREQDGDTLAAVLADFANMDHSHLAANAILNAKRFSIGAMLDATVAALQKL